MRTLLKHDALSLSELSAALVSPARASTPRPEFENRHDAHVALFHVHLPKLEDAALISDGWRDGPVSLGCHRDLRDGLLTPPLFETVEQEMWEAIAAATYTRHGHEVFVQLARSGPTLTLDGLVEGLVESATRPVERSRCGDGDRREWVAVGLHHMTLPRLDDAGLVSYDPTSHEVEYVGGRWFSLSKLADALEPRRTP